ncbi:MAG: phosphatidylserine decarboxylase [Clostridiales bacterium GWF2_36_10]|nr:MAG: phosphatidylserine decarboxylase [Clostridiales bacterium GWF2_36_10]
MDVYIKSREGKYIDNCISSDGSLGFLYGSVAGRIILKLLTKRFVSNIAGLYMNSRFSKGLIKSTVERANIDLNDYEKHDYRSYNDFFTRKIKSGKRPVDMNSNTFISPCDAKVSVYKITAQSYFSIKDSIYTVTDLLGGNAELADSYKGGFCLIFRLTVDDYHRYCYIDDGEKGDNKFIPGILHTVNPIALDKYNIYKRNCREYTVLKTKNYGEVTQVEVGAMMVGRIKNLHGKHSFTRGQEKGMFEFGGSTIVLLVKENIIAIDNDILHNTAENIETMVRYGEKIAVKVK